MRKTMAIIEKYIQEHCVQTAQPGRTHICAWLKRYPCSSTFTPRLRSGYGTNAENLL